MLTWKRTHELRFQEMLEMLPPATQTGHGFLVGEPWRHRKCEASGREDQPAFMAFVEHRREGATEYFEAEGPMTVAEFRALDPRTVSA